MGVRALSFAACILVLGCLPQERADPYPTPCPDGSWIFKPPVVVEFYGEGGVLPRETSLYTGNEYADATEEGTWVGVRALPTPYIQEWCPEVFQTDPPGLPCHVDTVLTIANSDGSMIDLLLGVPSAEVGAVQDGTRIVYGLTSPDYPWMPGMDLGFNVIVRRQADDVLLLAAMGWQDLEETPSIDLGQLVVERDDDHVCGYRAYMDCKHYGASAIRVSSALEERRVDAGETVELSTDDGTYRISLREAKDRTCFHPDGVCCADYEPDHFSYSIVLAR